MRRMDPTPSEPNVIDLFIKYGAAIGAVAYGLGFLEQSDLLRWLGVEGDFSFADPRYFAVGALLLSTLAPVLIVVPAQEWAHRSLSRFVPVLCFSSTSFSSYNSPERM